MGMLRVTDLETRPTEVLDLTSLTLDQFQQLVVLFEAAFQAYVADWRLDGWPCTARRSTTYTNCPLPMPEDRLLFMLVYLKTYPLQVVQGRLFGMGQSKAHQWLHVLLLVLRATLHPLGDTPTRSLAEAEAAALMVPTDGASTASDLSVAAPAPVSASPFLVMMGPNGASHAPRLPLSRRAVIAARTSATQSKTSC